MATEVKVNSPRKTGQFSDEQMASFLDTQLSKLSEREEHNKRIIALKSENDDLKSKNALLTEELKSKQREIDTYSDKMQIMRTTVKSVWDKQSEEMTSKLQFTIAENVVQRTLNHFLEIELAEDMYPQTSPSGDQLMANLSDAGFAMSPIQGAIPCPQIIPDLPVQTTIVWERPESDKKKMYSPFTGLLRELKDHPDSSVKSLAEDVLKKQTAKNGQKRDCAAQIASWKIMRECTQEITYPSLFSRAEMKKMHTAPNSEDRKKGIQFRYRKKSGDQLDLWPVGVIEHISELERGFFSETESDDAARKIGDAFVEAFHTACPMEVMPGIHIEFEYDHFPGIEERDDKGRTVYSPVVTIYVKTAKLTITH